jgi:hypothetical protein
MRNVPEEDWKFFVQLANDTGITVGDLFHVIVQELRQRPGPKTLREFMIEQRQRRVEYVRNRLFGPPYKEPDDLPGSGLIE